MQISGAFNKNASNFMELKKLKEEQIKRDTLFVATYMGTGLTLGQVVKELKGKGFTDHQLYRCILTCLKDQKWEI